MPVGSEMEKKGKDVQRDPPLRTALTVLPATQPFKEQVVPVAFKPLQCPDNRWCGPKRDEGQDLDSDLPVSESAYQLTPGPAGPGVSTVL